MSRQKLIGSSMGLAWATGEDNSTNSGDGSNVSAPAKNAGEEFRTGFPVGIVVSGNKIVDFKVGLSVVMREDVGDDTNVNNDVGG